MARKKNLGSRKFIIEVDNKIISIIIKENNESINEPKTPDKVFFGLIFVIFFHLNIFPNA